MRLTKRILDAATYEGANNSRCVIWDDEVPGFGLRIFPSGKKAFLLSYRSQGRKRLMTLGPYGVLTLDQARKTARAELAKVETEGADPVEARRQKAEDVASLANFGDLLDDYAATLMNPDTAASARQSFGKNIATFLRGKFTKDVTVQDVESVLSKVRERGALAVESNLFRFLHAAFEIGMGTEDRRKRYRINANPVTLARRPASRPAGNRELSANEIRELWQRLETTGMSQESITAFRLLLLTGQRVEEILGARWSEIDLERRVLDIPADRLKTGNKTQRGHVVPLSEMAIALFAAMPHVGPCVFPKRGDPQCPMPFRSLSQAADRLCNDPQHPFARFTPRDIRRSIKTRMSEIGILKEIRDRIQNHALHDVASKHYDRFDFLPDKRAGLDGWQWELRRILADAPLTEEWRKWLRRFVKEPDNDLPGRQLARLLSL